MTGVSGPDRAAGAARRTFKRPESVLVVIHTVDGEVLLLERRRPAEYWQSVTGSLDRGEAPAAAAVREVREETGLDVGDGLVDCRHRNRFEIVPPWRERYAPEDTHNLEHVFRVEYSIRPVIRINLSEHSRYRWLPRAEALTLASSRTNREAIACFVPER